MNLAQVDETKATQAYNSFVDDLQRCETLGIKLYNFHPGSTGGEPRAAAIGRIAAQLNKAHKATLSVITVLENMAGAGNVIGSTWEDLRDIIALVEDKDRVGVCIDTCHAFAAGHDLRTPEAFEETMRAFGEIVGFKYLKAFHCKFTFRTLSTTYQPGQSGAYNIYISVSRPPPPLKNPKKKPHRTNDIKSEQLTIHLSE